MKIEHAEVYGFRSALRGMRNPFDSWDKADSYYGPYAIPDGADIICAEHPAIGPEDLGLAVKLIKQGGDHRKFLRMIVIWCDFVLPRFVWQELDTYKVGTVRNSCSTMNTLGLRDLQQTDFERPLPVIILNELNKAVHEFREAKNKKGIDTSNLRVEMKNITPEGFLQRATYMFNYEVAYRIYWSRRRHRLPFWREDVEGSICSFVKTLPYMDHFLIRQR